MRRVVVRYSLVQNKREQACDKGPWRVSGRTASQRLHVPFGYREPASHERRREDLVAWRVGDLRCGIDARRFGYDLETDAPGIVYPAHKGGQSAAFRVALRNIRAHDHTRHTDARMPIHARRKNRYLQTLSFVQDPGK